MRKRVTWRKKFLRQMDAIIPWEVRVELLPFRIPGRPSWEIEPMLRMYLLQVWFNLSDEGTEDAVCDSEAMHNFVGIDFTELPMRRRPDPGDAHVVYGASGYLGVGKQAAVKDGTPLTRGVPGKKRSKSIWENTSGTNWETAIERGKPSVRSQVKHPFLIVMLLFGYVTVVHSGLVVVTGE